ncbi:MAG: hypothetical protein AAGC73_05630 [Verrucomicrobiota bacterium]
MTDDPTDQEDPSAEKHRTANFIFPTSRQDEEPDFTARKTPPKLKEAKRVGWKLRLLLVVLVVISFFPIFGNQTLWSDYDSVVRSPYKAMESWTEILSLSSLRHEDSLTLASYYLETLIPGPPAIVHRVINLILHLIAAFLFLRLLEFFRFSGAYASTLLFSLHPVVMQSLFWPGYRGQIITLILLLCALYYGIRNKDTADYTKCIVFTALTSLTQVVGIAVPFIVSLAIVYRTKGIHLNAFNRALPLLCIATFLVLWTQTGTSLPTEESGTDTLKALNDAGESMFFFITQAFVPFELSLFYPFSDEDRYLAGAELSLLPFFLFIPFYILIAINLRKRWSKAILLGLTAYLLLTIPGTYPIGAMIDGSRALEDHGNYIGLPFLLALVGIGFVGAMRKLGSTSELLARVGLGFVVFIQILLTASFSYTVGDPKRLWGYLSTQWPDSAPVQLAYLDAVSTKDGYTVDDVTLIRLLRAVVDEQPDRIEQQIELARAYARIDQFENASRIYRRLVGKPNPSNDLLEEAATFFDKLGFDWEARAARQRIQ